MSGRNRKSVPEIVKTKNGFSFLVKGRPFIMLAAETHNSACTSREYMVNVWRKAKELHCNTILAPVYWEMIEPEENHFDFTLAEQLVTDARKYNMKLVILWFGSFKNGLSTYVPPWVKTNLKRFPRTEDERGMKTRILSMFDSDILEAELHCFKELVKFIQEIDGEEQTVLAVQVENEIGVLGATRDFSPGAAKAYSENIPEELFDCPEKLEGTVFGDMIKESEKFSDRSWEKVFGEQADEVFMSWHYARYVNKLAKCAKECYPLPMYTNAWLKEFDDEKPGVYPCGGPVPEMLDIWKCAAPELDVLAPDVYTFRFEKTAEIYTRRDNPLFIPETRRDKWAPANLYTAIGTYHALCYAPFGAESIGENQSFITQIIHTDASDKNVSGETVKEYLSLSYKLIGNMMPVITGCYGTDRMIGFTQNNGYMTKHIKLGKYRIIVEFYHQIGDDNEYIPGAGIMIQHSEDELIFAGYGYRAFVETSQPGKRLDYLSLEKGFYEKDAVWVKTMDLNGDEQYIRMEEKPTVLRARYYEF